MFEIVRSKFESDKIEDFVAIGFYDSPYGHHSAFIIQHDEQLYEFHYTGRDIKYTLLSNDYFHKVTETVHPEEIPAFIAMCNQIKKKARPKYGFFYSGENYDSEGNHFGVEDLGQRMTCVGFCLNVLKGFLEEDYLNYSDWDENSHEDPNYLERFCEEHDLDIKKVKGSHRRISPMEFITTAFFSMLPIRRSQVEDKFDSTKKIIQRKQELASAS